MATIKDVAQRAQVAPSTISKYMNGGNVRPEHAEAIREAIAELGYTPDASARSFRTGKKKTIGFIVPDISNKFFADDKGLGKSIRARLYGVG